MDSVEVSSKILGTTEYRQLSEVERAVKFGKEAKISNFRAGEAVGVSKDAVWRGARAQAEGREIGVKGRPGMLRKNEMEEFIGLVRQKLANNEEVNYELAAELAKTVWNTHNANNLHFGPPDFSRKWLHYHFKKHGISMNRGRIVEPERIIEEDTIRTFFQNYQKVLNDFDIDPRLLWNADETEVSALPDRRKLAKNIGDPQPIKKGVKTGEHITLVLFVSAEPSAMTPTAIFPLATEPPLPDNLREQFFITGTESGWINGETLRTVVEKAFLAHLKAVREKHGLEDRWALLILDNHSSRRALINKALFEEQKLKILYIPPHSSALLQPLDLAPNGRFKSVFSRDYHPDPSENSQENRVRVMTAAADALTEALCGRVIRQGWERSGLYPVNPDVALRSRMVQHHIEPIPDKKKGKRGAPINKGRLADPKGQVMHFDPMAEENVNPNHPNKKKQEN